MLGGCAQHTRLHHAQQTAPSGTTTVPQSSDQLAGESGSTPAPQQGQSTGNETPPTTSADHADKAYYLSDIRFNGVNGDLIESSQLKQLPLLQASITGPAQNTATTGTETDPPATQPRHKQVDIDTLNAIVRQVSQAYIDAGYAAVRVTIRRRSLEDLEDPNGPGVLVIDVTEGHVAQVRTRALDGNGGIDNPKHKRIRDYSPIAAGDPVLLRKIDKYVDFMNRRPRRRVDAAISPSNKPGEVVFDYLVYEVKPWLVYAQTSNTGTEGTTKWRKQFGLMHYDLTGVDDYLAINYAGGDFDATHAASISYERPFADDPYWRWRVFGDWSRYDASEVGLTGVSFQGESWGAGAELLWNFHQSDGWFYDAIAGARFRNAMTDNAFASLTGETDYFIPYLGVRVENREIDSATTAQLMIETNLPDVAGTDINQVQRLGRTGADDKWVLVREEATHAFFLDTLFNDQTGQVVNQRPLVNEITATLRGQLVLGDERLPTNYTSSIGGFYSVRGYPEVFASADNSVAGSLEYRYHVPRAFAPDPNAGKLFDSPFRYRPQEVGGYTDWDLILKAFIDAGRVWHNEKLSFENDVTLIGSGVGVELQIKQNFSFRADWGFALRDAVNGSERVEAGSNRTHFLFTLMY